MKMVPEQEKILQGFAGHFGRDAEFASCAPGRLEILGNHTDYNQGTVLSVAVDRAMHIAAAPSVSDNGLCRVYDLKSREERTFHLDRLDEKRKGDWANYIKGLIVELKRRGCVVKAFDAVLYGTVPLSAGMSSSAALEMAMVMLLQRMNGYDLGWLESARIGQACENHYVGANTGLLDQFSSLKGRKGQLIYSDFRSFNVENVPMPAGSVFVVANSMVKHNLTNEYNERRESCETAAAAMAGILPGVKALRDVSLEQLEAARNAMPELAYRRALHVVGEMTRVELGRKCLAENDLVKFGRLMSESHASSIHNFENSCPEIDRIVEAANVIPGCLGGRISGGGFGGIAVFLVQQVMADSFMQRLKEACGGIQILQCEASDGAQAIPVI